MLNKEIIFLLALGISLLLTPITIKIIAKLKGGQNILEYVESHKSKAGTPTMGGLSFLLTLLIVFFVIFGKSSRLMTITLVVTLAYGILGFLDDFLKIKLKHNEGLKPYQKVIGQLGIAIILAIFVYNSGLVDNKIILPFGKEIELGIFTIPFVILFFVAVTNSVNLTDGLDGLAGGVSALFLFGFSLVIDKVLVSQPYMTELVAGEFSNLSLLSIALVGSLLGYLCYNFHPASVFMGDTGALALGGFIACVLTFTNMYYLMFTLGIMFVVDTISVVIQVLHYKRTKKRVFLMAPLHHHFEKKGYRETKIVFCYMAITCAMIAFSLILF